MERIRDSVRASCSSSFNSSTGLSFKRRPTCPANEEDWQADLLKDTSALPDRAARKEIERQRLRKLLNQGKKKRRRLNGNKLKTYPRNGVDDFHCHSREPHVPRKSRSVGYRRKGKSWRSIGLLAQLQLPTAVEKSSPLSVQNEIGIEIELEIAEVLSGLKKQVSSSDESLIDDLEKIRVENEDNQSISVHGCSVHQASKCVETVKSESISVSTNLEIQNHEKADLTTSQVIATPMEETESKQPHKFKIDLNEPPPMESSLEGDGMERLTPDPRVVFNEEVKSVSEEPSIRRFVLPWKMEIKGELQDLNLGSPGDTTSQKQQKAYSSTSIGSDLVGPTRIISTNPPQGFSLCGNLNSEFYSNNTTQENYSRPASTLRITHEHASHQIPKPLQAGRIKVGPLIFPLSQNQSVMANHQSGLSRTASPTGSVRFSYPIGAPFLSVLPGNVCATNPSYEGKRRHSSGGKNAQPVPFLDEQLHPQRIFLPIQIQHQKQAISSVADIRTFSGHRNVTPQSLYPHSPNLTSMPSAPSSFSFASSTKSPFHLSQNPEVVPSFLDKTKLGLQILPADHGLQHRNFEMIQKINQADSSLAAGNSPWIKQSAFILKSRSSTSPASMGPKVFDNSVTTPNCKLSAAKQNALSARIHQSNSNSLGASVQLKNQQQLQAMAASQLKRVPTVNNQHQPPIAAKVSNDSSIFSGNLYDRSSTLQYPSQQKLTIPNSQPLT